MCDCVYPEPFMINDLSIAKYSPNCDSLHLYNTCMDCIRELKLDDDCDSSDAQKQKLNQLLWL